MTVRENLGFALEVQGRRGEVAGRVAELADWLGLTAILDRWTVGLSGGEARRVALGRALAAKPDVLLLDEPLSALDSETAEGIVGLLQTIRHTRTTTVLHVTHDRAEAEQLADVILELRDGSVRMSN
jgi:ABC-type sulfate/molybdate transport systems ATPase subunit